MQKNVMYVIIFALTLVNITFFFFVMQGRNKPQSVLVNKQGEVVKEVEQIPEVIGIVNKKNAFIHSISCPDMKIKVWQNGMRFRLNGYFHYEKPDRFRMVFRSVFGKEVDIGSNDDIFWYWSRRNKRPGIFYAKHEDYNKTRLKTPFNPIFMKHSLGFNEIDIKDASIVQTEDDVIVLRKFLNSVGVPVVQATFVSKKNQRVEAFLITTEDGKPVASSEIKYQGKYPYQITYMWYEEQKILELDIPNLTLNAPIGSENWVMPDYEPKIDMSED